MTMNLCYYQQDQKQKTHHKITQRYIITQSYYAKEAETHITHYRADTDHVWIEIESLQWILGHNLLDLHINLEYRHNVVDYWLLVIHTFILLKKSLLCIFSEISNLFSILHIISSHSFDSKRR